MDNPHVACPACPACKATVTIEGFLASCSDHWAPLAVVKFRCPACGETTDAQLINGRISLGYIYAAGAPHFCGMVDVDVFDLSTAQDGTALAIEYEGRSWTIDRRGDGD